MTQTTNLPQGKIVNPLLLLVRRLGIRLALAAALLIGLTIGEKKVAGDQFQLSLTGGSVITVDVADQDLVWTDVLANGEMTKKKMTFSKVEQLVLSQSPASEQVAEIRRLLNMLESPEYIDRQKAEEQLSDAEIGGKFKSLIKTQLNHKKYEVRYRVERILAQLDTETQQNGNEFDKLILKDGTELEGDAGKFKLRCTYRDRELSFARSEIRMISAPGNSPRNRPAESEVKVKMFHDHKSGFFLPNQIKVDFELAPNGAELTRFTDVSELYTPFGLRMGAEKKGSVVISGFPFRFDGMPPAVNSICVYESIGNYPKRFKGVMEISFCMPNQPTVPAGVNEFGLFLGRVNHSRDFMIEAYNADGQLLAGVEATDRPCIFAGVKSTEPIVKVRILSNPYLFRVDRIIDEDYAVDDICFSPPVPVTNPFELEPGLVRLKNGDLLKGKKIEISDQGSISVSLSDGDPITLKRDELESIRFDTEKNVLKQDRWLAALPDRSVLLVEPGSTFKSETFSNLQFKPDQLMALWCSRNLARFPEADDFAKAKNIMVFPTCRIAADVKFSATGYRWGQSQKIEQPIRTTDEEDGEEDDPTPDISSIEYGKTGSESIPTLWLTSPKSQPAGTGQLRLKDGQQLTLGGETGFQLKQLQKDSVTISVAGKETEIPLSEILSINFPADQ